MCVPAWVPSRCPVHRSFLLVSPVGILEVHLERHPDLCSWNVRWVPSCIAEGDGRTCSQRIVNSRLTASGEATRTSDVSDLNAPKGQLLLQLPDRDRRRTTEAQDGLGKNADRHIHGRVFPVVLPTIGNEVRSHDG